MGKTWEGNMKNQNEAFTEYEILELVTRLEKETGYRLIWQAKDGLHDISDLESWSANEKLAKAISKKLKSVG